MEKAYPVAPLYLTNHILHVVNTGTNYKQVKKGVNEAMKALNRGDAHLIICACDTDPIEILMHLLTACEEKNVLYAFVRSKSALGRACQVTSPVVACAIERKEGSDLTPIVDTLLTSVEDLFV